MGNKGADGWDMSGYVKEWNVICLKRYFLLKNLCWDGQ